MIIKNNLASSPTLNYSVYVIGCIVVALFALVFTIYNFVSFSKNYADSSSIGKKIFEQESRLSKIEATAEGLNQEISKIKTTRFVEETKFMNHAIKRRTFSWTNLFDRFEEILPDNAKMISINPTIEGDEIGLNLELAAQDLQSMVETVRIFEDHKAFSDVTLRGENSDITGLLRFNLSMRYIPIQQQEQVVGASQQ